MSRWRDAARTALSAVGCPHPEPEPGMCCSLCSNERDEAFLALLRAARFVLAHGFERKWARDEEALDLLNAAIKKGAPWAALLETSHAA